MILFTFIVFAIAITITIASAEQLSTSEDVDTFVTKMLSKDVSTICKQDPL